MRGTDATRLLALAVLLAVSCSGPTEPTTRVILISGPATPPVIQSIAVPASRVETGVDVPITAVVVDAETPIRALAFQWSASAGTITGTGTTATWRMPAGLKSGVDVTITLRVVDTYDTVVNNAIVKQEFVVTRVSGSFRVHDSIAEINELARRFLVDLFGNSSVPPAACMVDFADVCANLGEGKIAELEEIVGHRGSTVLTNSQLMHQRPELLGPGFGTVHSAMLYTGHLTTDTVITSMCADFEVTVIYVGNRWWICESYYNRDDHSFCPSNANIGEASRAFRETFGRGKLGGGAKR